LIENILSVIFIITVIFTEEVVVATEECAQYKFNHPFYPGESCDSMNPESHDRSGYYWIINNLTELYCLQDYLVRTSTTIIL